MSNGSGRTRDCQVEGSIHSRSAFMLTQDVHTHTGLVITCLTAV